MPKPCAGVYKDTQAYMMQKPYMIAFAEIGIDAVYLSRTGFMKPRWIRT